MIDLKLNDAYETSVTTDDEILCDICEISAELSKDQEISNGFENCSFLLDHVNSFGVTDTIRSMVDGQLQYDSQEELVAGLEAILTKLLDKTFENISPSSGFQKNPRDTIRRFQRVVSKVRSILAQFAHSNVAITDRKTDLTLLCAARKLKAMAQDKYVNEAANGRIYDTTHDPINNNERVYAHSLDSTLREVNDALYKAADWLGSEKIMKLKESLSVNKQGLTAKQQVDIGRFIIAAKKQFQIIVRCVLTIYANAKRHMMRANTNKDVKVI